MTKDLQPTAKEIYYAAEQYLPFLPENLQTPMKTLLERAHAGEKVDNAILSLIAEDDAGRRWMRAALFGGETARLMGSDARLEGLAGDIGSVPANSIWVCPKRDCGFKWHVYRAGRPVPPCPRDGETLVKQE